MITEIKVDYRKRVLIVVHDIKMHGNRYVHNKFLEKEVPIPDSFSAENEKTITFEIAERLGIINISKLEEMVYQD